MNDKNITDTIQEINEKLDFIADQVRETQKRQRELSELKADLTLIGKDIFQALTSELDEVARHFDTADLLFLLKKLLRNTRNLIKVMDQMESAADFIQDATPLAKQVFNQFMESLNTLDKKGYFDFLGEFVKIFDVVVSTFSKEDVRHFKENVAEILLTLKNLTQPEMLSTVNNALDFFKKMDVEVDQKISYFQLLKEMRNPEFKQGVAFVIQFMKNMAKPVENQIDP
jgi:uncharacterized protein YjgD (DUF1641 family)